MYSQRVNSKGKREVGHKARAGMEAKKMAEANIDITSTVAIRMKQVAGFHDPGGNGARRTIRPAVAGVRI